MYHSGEKRQTKTSVLLTQGSVPYLNVKMVSQAPKQHRAENTVPIRFWSNLSGKSQKNHIKRLPYCSECRILANSEKLHESSGPKCLYWTCAMYPNGFANPAPSRTEKPAGNNRRRIAVLSLRYPRFFLASNMAPLLLSISIDPVPR